MPIVVDELLNIDLATSGYEVELDFRASINCQQSVPNFGVMNGAEL